ncbi:MAG: RpiB/LacA/LacB family sugar-phosphate isomerase, partial [bacterium]|nr:RpiB/LacA/LacB family sugar-phosphate isomerase [bacterium]
YLDYAALVCKKVLQIPSSFGILICGTGIGMSISANRFPGIRAALCTSAFMAERARFHDDANILVLGSENDSDEEFKQIVKVFLATKFSEVPRYKRRIKEIAS